jgi:hypothetical protein
MCPAFSPARHLFQSLGIPEAFKIRSVADRYEKFERIIETSETRRSFAFNPAWAIPVRGLALGSKISGNRRRPGYHK